jgi:cullin-4
MIRCIFLYLDRTYVIQTPNVKSIWDMGLDLFRTHFLGNSSVDSVDDPGVEFKNSIVTALLNMIENER